MSDSKINKNSVKKQEIIQTSNVIENNTNSAKSPPPTELLVEFLSSVMTKNYEMALKYCTEILKQEPNNSTALEFYPLIVEKLEMIKNEELESASSDSSSSTSSVVSSPSTSECGLNENDAAPNEWNENHRESLPGKKITGGVASYPLVPEKRFTNRCRSADEYKNTKTMESDITLHSTPKINFQPLLTDETDPPVKTTKNQADLPAKILVHPTETKTILAKNASRTRTQTLVRAREEKKEEDGLNKNAPSSKISLRATRTYTLPKKLPPPDSVRTENLQ